MKKVLFFIGFIALTLFLEQGFAQTTYIKVSSTSNLEVGANYLIVAHHDDYGVLAMGYQKPNNRHAVVVTENGNAITLTPSIDPNSETDVFQFTLGGSMGVWTLYDVVTHGYLYAASNNGNQLKTQSTLDANGQWSITFNEDGTAEVIAQGENTRNNLRFNPNAQNNSPMFSCYANSSNIDTRVSFYKEGGSVQPEPEPTNYPTNFTSTINGRDVTLTWNDAIGGQLPHKYLVIGSIGSITVPTDGIPLHDGNLVRNVNYGVQSVTFSNLNSNTTYHFAIFPYTNSGAYINYKNNGNYPTANATTEDITVLLFEDFNENLGVFTAYSAYGEQVWHQATYQGITYANMNGYANGVANANEDWLISPAINKTGFSDVFVKFNTAMKFEWIPLMVMISTNYNGQSDPNNYDWQDITNLFNYSSGNYEWVESGRINVGIPSNIFYLAFVYTSNTSNAPSWEIDYVSIEALSNGVNYYTITATANPTNGGTVTGSGTYQQGQQCTVSATPASNFTFLRWTENGSQVSTYADYTFTVTGNRTLVAEFNEIIPEYTITVNADPTNGGEVSGGGIYSLGATCVLTASPNPDFVFENWTRNDIVVSTSPSFDFEVTRNAEYVAHFVQDANHCTITAIADPFEGGAVSGGGTYELGTQCVLNAFPAVGFEFVNWTTQDGNQVSTNTQFGFTVTCNAVYIAHFRRIVSHYTITAGVEPAGAGSVIGAATFDEGDSCTLIAMPNPTYSFVSWTENGIVVSTDDHYTFTVVRDRNLVAVFSQGLFYTISASAGANGTISPEGDVFVEPGEDKTFAMIPNSGCSVQKVVVDGVDVGPVESYTFRSVNSDHTIHVQFSGLGVDDNTTLDLKVYPNPAKESLIVEGENMKRIAVFNLLGVQMAGQEVNDSHTSLNIDGLTKGTYILKVEYADGTVGYMRFVAAD